MIRRIALLMIVGIVALLVVGDRVAAHYAENKVAAGIQDAEHLPSTPDVTIHGIPFLTQLVNGRYHNVEVVVHGFRGAGVTVDVVDAHLRGVLLPFSDVIHGDVNGVPVDRVDGAAVVSYAELTRVVGHGVTYAYAGNGRIKASLGGVSAEVRVSVNGRDLVLSPFSGSVGAADVLLPHLPFHLHLESVTATGDGVRIVVGARHVVFRAIGFGP